MLVIIKEKTQGLILWSGKYPSIQDAFNAYRSDLGAEAFDYDAVDPDWMEGLEIETV